MGNDHLIIFKYIIIYNYIIKHNIMCVSECIYLDFSSALPPTHISRCGGNVQDFKKCIYFYYIARDFWTLLVRQILVDKLN